MKKAYITALLMSFFVIFGCYNAKSQTVRLNAQSSKNVTMELNINEFTLNDIEHRGQTMYEIGIDEIVLPMEKGIPNVPIINRFIAIPQGATAEINIISFEKETLSNIEIAPSLGYTVENHELSRDYSRDESIYTKDEMFPGQIVTTDAPTSLRGVDAVLLHICPVQYNPVKKEVEIYRNIVFSIDFEDGNGHFGDDRLRSPYWDPILANNIVNYESLPVVDYEKRMLEWLRDGDYGAEYLIVVPNDNTFRLYANKLADYRRKQGILTRVVSISEMNILSLESMKEWFHNAYNSWDIPPVAVCLLGDHIEDFTLGIPAMVSEHPWDGECLTDNFYADVNDDEYPDMCFSRLVANNASELPIFVDRQIEYEFTNPNMNAYSYEHPITCVGWDSGKWFQMSLESVGGYLRGIGKTPTRINGVYSGTDFTVWSNAQNATNILDYFGPNGLQYIEETPVSLGNWEGGTGVQVVGAINMGASIVQQRDHGWDYIWYQPSLQLSHLDNLKNVGRLPFLFSVNCRTGSFGRANSCVLESFIRRTYDGQNAGIVGGVGPTGQSYTYTNDVLMWGIWDFLYHDFLPEFGVQGPFSESCKTDKMPAFALVSAKYFLAASSFPNQSDEARKYTNRMYHSHCDAFLRVFTEVPQEIPVSHDPVFFAGEQSFHITAPEGTTIGLSRRDANGRMEILASAVGNSDNQLVELSETLIPGDTLFITVAGENYLRYEGGIISIVSEGPYLAMTDYSLNYGMDTICNGENVVVDMQIKNLGVDDSSEGTVRISTESQYVTLNGNEYFIPAIPHGDSLAVENIFNFDLANNTPDGENIVFNIEIESMDITTYNILKLKASGPNIEIGKVVVLDTLGQVYHELNPGEYAKLSFQISNYGSCISDNTTAYLIDNVGSMRVITESIEIDPMEIGQQEDIVFDVYIEWWAGDDCLIDYTLRLESGDYVFEKDFITQIGLFYEDFESGELDPSIWHQEVTFAPWSINSDMPYEGLYCLKSYPIGDNGSSAIKLTFSTMHGGEMSFYYKVSSEKAYDFLKFYIDDVVVGYWSDEIDWIKNEFEVEPGKHTYKWEYVKDYSVSNGLDCAFIDNVSLPPSYDVTLEFESSNNTIVYPNPSDGVFHIQTADNEDVISVRICDMSGRTLLERNNTNEINASELPNGLYIMELTTATSKIYEKVIINR